MYLVCVVLHSRNVIKIVICTFALVLCGLLLCTSGVLILFVWALCFCLQHALAGEGGGGARGGQRKPVPSRGRDLGGRVFLCVR